MKEVRVYEKGKLVEHRIKGKKVSLKKPESAKQRHMRYLQAKVGRLAQPGQSLNKSLTTYYENYNQKHPQRALVGYKESRMAFAEYLYKWERWKRSGKRGKEPRFDTP
jgi:hypothetical protein